MILKFRDENGKSLGISLLALALVAGLALSWFHPVNAQQQAKIAKVGLLSFGSVPTTSTLRKFIEEFRNLGYFEDKTFTIESRFANSKLDRLPLIAQELVRLKVEVIVAGGSNDALAAKRIGLTIPPNVLVRSNRVIR